MKGIQNIIFDLGGVIINLDVANTITEFNRLSPISFESIYTQANQIKLFNDFDKGLVSTQYFFDELRKLLRVNTNNEDLLFAWNAMLKDIPEERLDVLVNAKQNYSTFLLSNTCEPHIFAFENDLHTNYGVKNFSDYFDETYYSCRIGMRKPDKEIFEYVLQKNNLLAAETVFIDDSIQHVKSAGECGINAFLLPKNMEIKELLQELKLL
jgi:glucose-1-phosphatase